MMFHKDDLETRSKNNKPVYLMCEISLNAYLLQKMVVLVKEILKFKTKRKMAVNKLIQPVQCKAKSHFCVFVCACQRDKG